MTFRTNTIVISPNIESKISTFFTKDQITSRASVNHVSSSFIIAIFTLRPFTHSLDLTMMRILFVYSKYEKVLQFPFAYIRKQIPHCWPPSPPSVRPPRLRSQCLTAMVCVKEAIT